MIRKQVNKLAQLSITTIRERTHRDNNEPTKRKYSKRGLKIASVLTQERPYRWIRKLSSNTTTVLGCSVTLWRFPVAREQLRLSET